MSDDRLIGRSDQDDSVFIGSLSWSAGASLVSGLGALGFLTVGRIAVGLADFAPMAHMWTVWSISAATIGFGSQIDAVESLTRSKNPFSGRQVRLSIIAVVAVGAVTWFWRVPLFASTGLFWPTVCAVVPVGSLTTGVARGVLAGRGKNRRLALVIAGENLLRLLAAIIVLKIAGGTEGLAIALLLGFVVAGLGWFRSRAPEMVREPGGNSSGRVGAFAGLVAHMTLVMPPALLAVHGASSEVVAATFLVLTYMRAPYQFLLGLAPSITARSFAPMARKAGSLAYGRQALQLTALLAIGAALLAGIAGDWLLEIMIGTSEEISRWDLALTAALVIVVASAMLRTIVVLGMGGQRLVLQSWASTAAVSVAVAVIASSPTLLLGGLLLATLSSLVPLTIRK